MEAPEKAALVADDDDAFDHTPPGMT